MACGDMSGFDSDRTYPLDLNKLSSELTNLNNYKYKFKEVVQPPTDPCYKKACELKIDLKLSIEQCEDVQFETGFSDDDYDLNSNYQDLCLNETSFDRIGQKDIDTLLKGFPSETFMSDEEDEFVKRFKNNSFSTKNELAINDFDLKEDEFLANYLADTHLN